MFVTLIGLGGGTRETLTDEARRALEQAEAVLGAGRLLENLPHIEHQARIAETRAAELFARLQALNAARPCVVYSGDAGFYSGASGLSALLREAGIAFRVLPGLSSVQLLSARLGEAWQDWALYSAHGTDCDPIAALMGGRPAFFLTGGKNTPASLCRLLTEAGLGSLRAVVGEKLSCPDERIVTMSAAACAETDFTPLSVLLVNAAPRPVERTGGIPDDAFLRAAVPMTKQEIRAAVLAKLAVLPTDTVWDVGAGTGSVSVELALAARHGRAFAVEYKDEALDLIRRNRKRWTPCPRRTRCLSAAARGDLRRSSTRRSRRIRGRGCASRPSRWRPCRPRWTPSPPTAWRPRSHRSRSAALNPAESSVCCWQTTRSF